MISACLIVKDEENMLAGCLSSIKSISDEIIIVDTGSKDSTMQIAKKFGSKTYNFTWNGDFSAARNYSLSKASNEWILVIDADEILESQDAAGIKKLVTHNEFDAFSVIQRTYTDDSVDLAFVKLKNKRYGFSGYFDVEVIRLFRNNNSYKYSGKVHELLDDSMKGARIGRSDVVFHHLEHIKGEESVKKKQLSYLKTIINEINSGNENEKLLCDAALLSFRYKKDYGQAEKFLEQAAKANQKSIRPRMLLGQLYAQQSKFQESIKQYEFAKLLPGSPIQLIEQNISQLKKVLSNSDDKSQQVSH
ncbi:MAG: glycosyltransferase [Nanoarchaeota archaeon]